LQRSLDDKRNQKSGFAGGILNCWLRGVNIPAGVRS
jgi:hypothetical protein